MVNASKWVRASARFSPSGAGGAAGGQPDALLAPSSERRVHRSISPRRGNSACIRAPPLPTKAIRLCGAPIYWSGNLGCPEIPVKPWSTSAYLSAVGLLPYLAWKSPQIPRYGSNNGSQVLSVAGQCRKERKGRKILGAVFCVTCGTYVTPRCTSPPPAAGRCSGSCGRSAPALGDCPSRDSSAASAVSARSCSRCRS